MSALVGHQASPSLRASGADDRHSRRTSQLHRGDAHASTRAMDKDYLAGYGTRPREKRPIRSGVRDIDRSSLRVADRFWQWMHLGWDTQGEFGISAADVAHVNSVARRYST